MTRATMSGRPPAACGTIILTGREGQLCAVAKAGLRTRAAQWCHALSRCGGGSHRDTQKRNDCLPNDPSRCFAPLALLASAPLVLVVPPSVPADSFKAFVALARSRPGQLNYASNGNGSSSHLAAVMFGSMTGVDMVHVPYKGLSPALADLLSGRVQLMFSSVVAILPHIKSGKLRGLALTGSRRLPSMPDLPTIAESGLPGYEASSWYGVLAPAGTPREIVARLNAELVKALAQPEVRTSLLAEGAEPAGGTPEQFAAHIRAEKERLGKLIREAKIRLE